MVGLIDSLLAGAVDLCIYCCLKFVVFYVYFVGGRLTPYWIRLLIVVIYGGCGCSGLPFFWGLCSFDLSLVVGRCVFCAVLHVVL